jgi:hypothetical protein
LADGQGLLREIGLHADWLRGQFHFNRLVGNERNYATLDQICDSLAVALGVPKKLDAELIVFVPPHDGDFDGKRRFYFRSFEVQGEVASRDQNHVALHSAACCREIEEYPFRCAVVGLNAGGIPHILSRATP